MTSNLPSRKYNKAILQKHKWHWHCIIYQQPNNSLPTPEGYRKGHCSLHQNKYKLATTNLQANQQNLWHNLFHNAIFAYSSQNTPAQQWYQPGLTMISSTGTLALRHLETGIDPSGMGTYSHHKITGANAHKINFISAY
jgi:hypothetical protein